MVYEPPKEEDRDEKDKDMPIPTSQELEEGKMETFLDSLDKHVY
jgi:hypothetical protein